MKTAEVDYKIINEKAKIFISFDSIIGSKS